MSLPSSGNAEMSDTNEYFIEGQCKATNTVSKFEFRLTRDIGRWNVVLFPSGDGKVEIPKVEFSDLEVNPVMPNDVEADGALLFMKRVESEDESRFFTLLLNLLEGKPLSTTVVLMYAPDGEDRVIVSQRCEISDASGPPSRKP